MTASRTASFGRTFGIQLVLLLMSACGAGPDLRVADEVVPEVSAGEGKRLLEEGRAVDAVAAFRRRMREDGKDLQALNGLAIAYGELGRTDLAAEMFSRALAMSPNDPATLNNIGFAALRRADERLARHYLEKARQGDGRLEKIEGNLAQLAWLEKIDRRRAMTTTLKSAAITSEARPSYRGTRISLLGGQKQAATIASVPKVPRPGRLPRSMIDFTAVNDPFSQRRAAE